MPTHQKILKTPIQVSTHALLRADQRVRGFDLRRFVASLYYAKPSIVWESVITSQVVLAGTYRYRDGRRADYLAVIATGEADGLHHCITVLTPEQAAFAGGLRRIK